MRKKFLNTIIFFTIIGLVFIFPLAGNSTMTTTNTTEYFQVNFKKMLTPQETLILLQRTGTQLISFNHIAFLGDEIVKGGYFVHSLNPEVIIQDYQRSHLSFLQDLAKEKENKVTYSDPLAESARNLHLALVESELAKQNPFTDLRIESIIISGDEDTINQISHYSIVSEIQKVPREINQNLTQSVKKNTKNSQLDYVNPLQWVPAQGTSYVQPSSVGGRYVQQNMYWNSSWNVSGFGANSTYEHDFFLNNYDNFTYLSSSQYITGIPIVSYWSSNLPQPYLDTRLGDPSGEKAYTIGSAKAAYIMPYQMYWYYIRTVNGNANADNGKLTAQLGYRSPSWCYSTWCSYGDPTTPIQFLIPAWNIAAPGTYNWTR